MRITIPFVIAMIIIWGGCLLYNIHLISFGEFLIIQILGLVVQSILQNRRI
jgi:hypothetical protein